MACFKPFFTVNELSSFFESFANQVNLLIYSSVVAFVKIDMISLAGACFIMRI